MEKNFVGTDFDHKMVEIGVELFRLTRRVQIFRFFYLEIA
jgi:hypothetical protein